MYPRIDFVQNRMICWHAFSAYRAELSATFQVQPFKERAARICRKTIEAFKVNNKRAVSGR
jgi:hypothetical protein